MSLEDEQRQLESARRELLKEFSGTVPAEQVEQGFDELVAEFRGAPIQSFVPVLVQRRVRERLRPRSG